MPGVLHQFGHVHRVATRFPDQVLGLDVRGVVGVEQDAGERARLVICKRCQGQLHRRTRQRQLLGQRRPTGHEQHALWRPWRAQTLAQELQALVVGPVHVVDDRDDRVALT